MPATETHSTTIDVAPDPLLQVAFEQAQAILPFIAESRAQGQPILEVDLMIRLYQAMKPRESWLRRRLAGE